MCNLFASLDKFKCEHVTMLFHESLHSDVEHVKLFPLHFSEEVKQFNIDSDEFVRAGKDWVFTKIHSIFIYLQALLCRRYHESVFRPLGL